MAENLDFWERKVEDVEALTINDFGIVLDARFGPFYDRKREFVDELKKIVSMWRAGEDFVDSSSESEINSYLGTMLSKLETASREANRLIENGGFSSMQFRDGRQNIIGELSTVQQDTRVRRLAVHGLLLAAENRAVVKASGVLTADVEKVAEILREGNALIGQLDTKNQILSEKVDAKRVEEATAAFSERVRHHKKREEGFAVLFSIASLVLIGVSVWLISRDLPASAGSAGSSQSVGAPQLVKYVLEAVLSLSLATAFCQIMLRRWNVERHLRLLYEHRTSAIRQYRYLDSLIGPDSHADKQALRLAVAQLTLVDPATGYLDEKVREMNISPAITIVEKAGKLTE